MSRRLALVVLLVACGGEPGVPEPSGPPGQDSGTPGRTDGAELPEDIAVDSLSDARDEVLLDAAGAGPLDVEVVADTPAPGDDGVPEPVDAETADQASPPDNGVEVDDVVEPTDIGDSEAMPDLPGDGGTPPGDETAADANPDTPDVGADAEEADGGSTTVCEGLGAPCPGPSCSEVPCVLWERTIWQGYTEEALPIEDSDTPGSVPLRAPVAPRISFEEHVIVQGSWLPPDLGFTAVLWELDPEGFDAAFPGLMPETPPTDCVVVAGPGLLLINHGQSVWLFGTGEWDPFPQLHAHVGWIGSLHCPVAASPGWMISGDGNAVELRRWWPIESVPKGQGWSTPGVGRSPVIAASGIVFGTTSSLKKSMWAYNIHCDDTGCDGGSLGSIPTISPIVGELAISAKDGAFGATQAQTLIGYGLFFEILGADGVLEASPVVGADGAIFVGSTSGVLYAVAPTWPQESVAWTFDTGAPILSAATVSANGLLYVANEAPALFAIDQASGAEVWSMPLPGRPAQGSYPLTDEGVLYVSAGVQLLAVQVEAGGLAKSPWPKTQFDNQGRGNAGLENGVPQPLPDG